MYIPTRITRGNSNKAAIRTGNKSANTPLHQGALSGTPAAPGFQSPIEAFQALEQWRVLEEETVRSAVRWPMDHGPIQVAFEAHSALPAAAAIHKELFQAMQQWEVASQGLIQFQQQDFPLGASHQAPDIVIHWSEETVLGRDYEVGHTHRAVQGQRIRHARITLILNPIIDGHLSPLQQKQRLYATILHETGHALGLEHSDNPQDVMHHRGWQRPYLSPGDIQRIQQLYAQNPRFMA